MYEQRWIYVKGSVIEAESNSNLSYVPRISLNRDLLINLIDITRRGKQTKPGCSKKKKKNQITLNIGPLVEVENQIIGLIIKLPMSCNLKYIIQVFNTWG